MKKITFLLIFSLLVFKLSAQNSSVKEKAKPISPAHVKSDIQEKNILSGASVTENGFILKNVPSEKEDYYKSLISKANLESYRLKETDVTLSFEEGFECILLSARSLSLKGFKLDVGSYPKAFENSYILPVFSVQEGGTLKATYQKISK